VSASHSASHSSHRRGNQSRQQQRIKLKRKSRSHEASKLQRLYKIYSKRAVRRVLGETLPPYPGSIIDATSFLTKTYSRPQSSSPQLPEAKALFDSCNWLIPNNDQSSGLDSPPSSNDIEIRLRRASNTSPGPDKLEYHHLRLLDSRGYLLEKIFAAVWRLGIPDIWRSSRTVSIYKKRRHGGAFELPSHLTSVDDVQGAVWNH